VPPGARYALPAMGAAPSNTAAREILSDLTWSVLGPRRLPALEPPAVPLHTLEVAVRRARRPVVLVNDAHRPLPAGLVEVVRHLWELGGEEDHPRVLVATGAHEGSAAAYRDRMGGLPVGVHDARDARAHMALEGAGEGVNIDRRVADADLVLAFGSVEPHYFAGWSGAHKTASVGVLDRAAIERNHRGALAGASRLLALEGNPVFDGLAKVLASLEAGGRTVLCVNHVMDPEGRPVSVAAGTWRESLERSLPAARAQFVRDVPGQVDVLVARVLGPLGRNLYQAEKGLKNNEDAVRDGGAIVIEAGLEDGVGPDRFVRLLEEAPALAAALERVAAGYVLGDHKAVKWRRLEARGVRIHVASPHLDPAAVARAGIRVHGDLRAALAAVRDERSGGGVGLIVEDAGTVVTRVTG